MVRGLGLLFKLPDGEEWRTAMINTPVFALNTPQAFFDRLVATRPDPQTGKPTIREKMAACVFGESSGNRAGDKDHIQSHPRTSSGLQKTAHTTV